MTFDPSFATALMRIGTPVVFYRIVGVWGQAAAKRTGVIHAPVQLELFHFPRQNHRHPVVDRPEQVVGRGSRDGP